VIFIQPPTSCLQLRRLRSDGCIAPPHDDKLNLGKCVVLVMSFAFVAHVIEIAVWAWLDGRNGLKEKLLLKIDSSEA
jgi:hypothetical protein